MMEGVLIEDVSACVGVLRVAVVMVVSGVDVGTYVMGCDGIG